METTQAELDWMLKYAGPELRARAFDEAMAAEDAAIAFAIARFPLPMDWPEDLRREWGPRRELARATTCMATISRGVCWRTDAGSATGGTCWCRRIAWRCGSIRRAASPGATTGAGRRSSPWPFYSGSRIGRRPREGAE